MRTPVYRHGKAVEAALELLYGHELDDRLSDVSLGAISDVNARLADLETAIITNEDGSETLFGRIAGRWEPIRRVQYEEHETEAA